MENTTMNGTYQSNYKNKLAGTGREVRISDEATSYYYDLAEGDTLLDAVDSFADSYDFNSDAETFVRLDASLYIDGVEADTEERTISNAR